MSSIVMVAEVKAKLLDVLRDREWHSAAELDTGWLPYLSVTGVAQALRQDGHEIEERREREGYGLRLVRRPGTMS